MQEDSNPVKEYLFDYIKNSQIISQLIAEKKFDKIIEDVMDDCYEKIISMGEKDEVIGILATGLLHYLLTNALITSQRKIEYQGIELDIVIPNIKTLEKDPKKTLLICIPKSSNKNVIDEKNFSIRKNSISERKHLGSFIRKCYNREEILCYIKREKYIFKNYL